MDGQSAVVVVDKAMLPEPVHEMTDPRPGRADHLCQGVLIHSGDLLVRPCFPCRNGKAARESEPNAFRSN